MSQQLSLFHLCFVLQHTWSRWLLVPKPEMLSAGVRQDLAVQMRLAPIVKSHQSSLRFLQLPPRPPALQVWSMCFLWILFTFFTWNIWNDPAEVSKNNVTVIFNFNQHIYSYIYKSVFFLFLVYGWWHSVLRVITATYCAAEWPVQTICLLSLVTRDSTN